MIKRGQIDNSEEFLKLYPERSDLNIKDLDLRAKYQIIKKSATYRMLSSDLILELNLSNAAVRSYKSKVIRDKTSIGMYESALMRFEKAIVVSRRKFKENLNLESNLAEINGLEKKLLKLPSKSLEELLLKVITKAGIFLVEKKETKELNFAEIALLHKELEEKYRKNKKMYSLVEKRHLANAFCTLRKAKSGPGNQREIQIYCKRIYKLREILNKE